MIFRRISETVWELLLGIFLCGILAQLAGVLFAPDIKYFSTGLWVGIFYSCFMVFSMNQSIQKAVMETQKDAAMQMIKGYVIRILVMVVLVLLLLKLSVDSVLTFLVGAAALKVAAYLQPITHKIIRRVRH